MGMKTWFVRGGAAFICCTLFSGCVLPPHIAPHHKQLNVYVPHITNLIAKLECEFPDGHDNAESTEQNSRRELREDSSGRKPLGSEGSCSYKNICVKRNRDGLAEVHLECLNIGWVHKLTYELYNENRTLYDEVKGKLLKPKDGASTQAKLKINLRKSLLEGFEKRAYERTEDTFEIMLPIAKRYRLEVIKYASVKELENADGLTVGTFKELIRNVKRVGATDALQDPAIFVKILTHIWNKTSGYTFVLRGQYQEQDDRVLPSLNRDDCVFLHEVMKECKNNNINKEQCVVKDGVILPNKLLFEGVLEKLRENDDENDGANECDSLLDDYGEWKKALYEKPPGEFSPSDLGDSFNETLQNMKSQFDDSVSEQIVKNDLSDFIVHFWNAAARSGDDHWNRDVDGDDFKVLGKSLQFLKVDGGLTSADGITTLQPTSSFYHTHQGQTRHYVFKKEMGRLFASKDGAEYIDKICTDEISC